MRRSSFERITPVFPETAVWLRSRLGRHHLATVLNLGSGTKEYWSEQQRYIFEEVLNPLAQRDCIVFNVDSKPENCSGRNLIPVLSTAADVPFSNGIADVVLCLSILEHTENPGALVAEARRVCSADGTAFFEVPDDYPSHPDPIDTGLRMHSLDEWVKLLGCQWKIREFAHIRSEAKKGSCSIVEAIPA